MTAPIQGKRAQRRAQRREDVLDAAMRIIIGEGVNALTIQRLAKATNASVGGLYRYYESKEAVVAALQLRAIAVFGEVQREELERAALFAQAKRPAVDPKVAALFAPVLASSAYLRFERREPERHHLLSAFLSAKESLLPTVSAQEVDMALRPLIAFIASHLDEAAERGALRKGDSVQRTFVLWAAMHGLDNFRKRDRVLPEQLRVCALCGEMVRGLFGGWGADRAQVDAAIALVKEFEAIDAERIEAARTLSANEFDVAAS